MKILESILREAVFKISEKKQSKTLSETYQDSLLYSNSTSY